ncbi:hypothetical protein FZEAL_6622 [Fusarium zealandicum]|uniref:Uncharacterized protein n=1 Tax=Fusarium zealandicum TaxID=1053134 RepID=A0A8H4XIP3_9HYPO|nr:hypothetical protein FZEAL_6622 [Fusarium zealandicum]
MLSYRILPATKVVLLVGSLVGTSIAQNGLPVNETIFGCADVGCNDISTAGVNDETNCTVVDQSLNTIGFTQVPFDRDSPFWGLSWVEGIGPKPNSSDYGNRHFYLGTPVGVDMSFMTACAFFFTNINKDVEWKGHKRESQGNCEEALSSGCVEAMTDRASKFNIKGMAAQEACEAIRDDFVDNFDSACASISPVKSRDKWLNVTAQRKDEDSETPPPSAKMLTLCSLDLTGKGAPSPISKSENETSTCWPVLPKSADLTFVRSFGAKEEGIFWSIVPILTVLVPGESSPMRYTQSHMSCLKPRDDYADRNRKEVQDRFDEDTDKGDDDSGAVLSRLPAMALLGLSLLATVATVCL